MSLPPIGSEGDPHERCIGYGEAADAPFASKGTIAINRGAKVLRSPQLHADQPHCFTITSQGPDDKEPITTVLAAQTAEAYLSQGNYAKAAELYRTALSKGGVNADEVNTRLGIALANGGDKAGAQAAFAAVKGQPRADIAALWTTWINASAA